MKNKKTFKILIAHQSTIPHYRVSFYQMVQKLKPNWWEFEVIYDERESKRHFFMDSDIKSFAFNIKNSRGFNLDFLGRKLSFQFFPFTSWKYDLLVVGQAMNNIAYPISFIRKLFGKSIAYWGQGRDLYTIRKGALKKTTESLKLMFTNLSDGFFAYTEGVKSYLISKGVNSEKIFPLQNTMDIEYQRNVFSNLIIKRNKLRRELNLEHKKVLLYVGRFNREKRIDTLTQAFINLSQKDEGYVLLVVGGGNRKWLNAAIEECGEDKIKLFGVVPENEIGKYFVISDLFVMPGSVGLNVIQAMCYNLIPVVIDSPFQSPEYEYLNKSNSIIVKNGSDALAYANAIHELFLDADKKKSIEENVWDSIKHLTIKQMAENFINGINLILEKKQKR